MTSLFSVDKPFVFKASSRWPASSWTPSKLACILKDLKTDFRIGHKVSRIARGVQWESDCDYVQASFQHFVDWLESKHVKNDDNPLRHYDVTSHWCYADYKYMRQLFADHPDLIKAVDWSVFGFPDRDGLDSTFWMGSEGAQTPCHYDTYGCNLVAQIYGRKQWIMFSPDETDMLYPTRIPFEESSVFSEVNIQSPDLSKHTKFKHSHAYIVTLEPGDVLFVPHHWWHYVYSLQTSISINTWLEMPEDDDMRLQEAVTRMLVSSLMQDAPKKTWLNPTEVSYDVQTNLEYLNRAVQNLQVTPHNIQMAVEECDSGKAYYSQNTKCAEESRPPEGSVYNESSDSKSLSEFHKGEYGKKISHQMSSNHTFGDHLPSNQQLPSNCPCIDHLPRNDKSASDYNEVFTELDISDYTEVKSRSLGEYLTLIGYDKPSPNTGDSNTDEVHNNRLVNEVDNSGHFPESDETTTKSQDLPFKKRKLEDLYSGSHGDDGNHNNDASHGESGSHRDSDENDFQCSINLELFTKCVTRPKIVSFICELLKQNVEIKC